MDGESKHGGFHHSFLTKAFCSLIEIKTTVEATGFPISTASEDVNPGPTAVMEHWEDLDLQLVSGLFLSQNHTQTFGPEGTSAMETCIRILYCDIYTHAHIVHDLINPNAESIVY